jgi:predicted outer membrane repeat protein
MRNFFTLIFAFLMLSLGAISQNVTVNDTIDVSATWSADTIFVDTNIVILDDVILTIDPGVKVIFNDFYHIDVKGTILAEGTEGNKIEFTVLDTSGYHDFSHTGWDGIEFNDPADDNDESVFDYCSFSFAKEESNDGGAIRIYDYKDVSITNSIFKYNQTDNKGGAIGIEEDAEAFIDNCTFLYNVAEYGGGAISVGCYSGEYYVAPIIQNSHFEGNQSLSTSYGGGAIKTSAYAKTRIINNTITGNSSNHHGGGILASGYGAPFIYGNLIYNNTSDGYYGGGIKISYDSSPYIANNTIIGNDAYYGGGIHCGYYDGTTTIVNNIIISNTASDSGDNLYLYFSGNDREVIMAYNLLEEGEDEIYLDGDVFFGVNENNIDEDPLFADYGSEDFSVESGSPVIDAGATLFGIPDIDLLGNPRISGSAVDIGAIETVFSTGIRNANSFDQIGVYPNPSNGVFTIEAKGNAEILNANGQILKTIEMNDSNSTRVDISEYKTGVYFIRFKNGNKTQKIIVL